MDTASIPGSICLSLLDPGRTAYSTALGNDGSLGCHSGGK